MPQYVSADHIAAAGGAGKYEPQRTNNFTIQFSFPQGVGGPNATDILALSVQQIPFPSQDTTPIEVPFGNETRKVSGKWKFSNETLTVSDYVDSETADIIDKWCRKVYDPESGKIGYANQYKVSGDLIMFGPDGTKKRVWSLRGMWPMRTKMGEGNMGSPAHNKIEVEFCVDKIIYKGRVGN